MIWSVIIHPAMARRSARAGLSSQTRLGTRGRSCSPRQRPVEGCRWLLLLDCRRATGHRRRVKKKGPSRVHSISFVGVHAIPIVASRRGASRRARARSCPGARKRYFDRSRFDADVKRIQAFYADRGYPNAQVTGFDVKLNARQDAVDVTLTIAEGEPVRVASLEFAGFEAIPAEHLRDRCESARRSRSGSRAIASWRRPRRNWRSTSCATTGFPTPRCRCRKATAPTARGGADADGRAWHEAVFGPVEIAGNKSVERKRDSARAGLHAGRSLPPQPGAGHAAAPVPHGAVSVCDGHAGRSRSSSRPRCRRGSPSPKASISASNSASATAPRKRRASTREYHHSISSAARGRQACTRRWSSLDRGLRVDFTQPYVFQPHFSLNAEAQQWYTDHAGVSIGRRRRQGIADASRQRQHVVVGFDDQRARQQHDRARRAERSRRCATISSRSASIRRTGEQNGTIDGGRLRASSTRRSTTLLDAHRGYQVTLQVDQAGEVLGGTFTYTACRPTSGTIWASAIGLVARQPGAERQHRAGQWRRHRRAVLEEILPGRRDQHSRLGPLRSRSAERIGSADWRQQHVRGAAASCARTCSTSSAACCSSTAAMSGRTPAACAWTTLRYAVGPGLRYQTPVGPLRFDFGYQLNPIPNLARQRRAQTRHWRVHISIGQAF